MIEKIKEIRVQLDGLTQLTENIKNIKTKIGSGTIMGYKCDSCKEGFTTLGTFCTNCKNPKIGEPLISETYIEKTSKETEEAVKSLQLSKMWLGKVLKELGTANPYPESKNPDNEKIEPTADTFKLFPKDLNNYNGGITYNLLGINNEVLKDLNHIQKVKWLRAEIEKAENNTKETYDALFDNEDLVNTTWLFPSIIKSIEYTVEAGMWLGIELGRIRDEKNN